MPSPALELFESKLQPPWARSGLVPRTAVLDRLLASKAPIIATVAPPGYGKTTLLAQWSERNQRPTAWISLDERDNDPARLLGYIAAALDRVEPIDPAVLRSLASPGVVATSQILPRLGLILSSRHASFSLVIDHLEAIHEQQCVDAIVELAAHLPVRSQLAVGSRDEPPLPMARLRASGQVIEVGVGDLAMDEADARALLSGADVALGEAELTALVDRTEGWPVGLYLAALAMKTGGASASVGLAFSGDHRLMADYLRSEVLSRLPPTSTEFLRRTSVLDRLSGPLCDAVLGSARSQEILESLERSNLLLVPLDRQRVWYRYHHLFRDLLRAELMRSEAELVPLLHDRAATWFETNGLPDVAIDHVQAAGDASRAAYLCARFAQPTFAAGHVDTALRWLGWFEDRGLIEQYPQLAMLRALADAMLGRTAEISRWAELAESASGEQWLPDGSPLTGWVAVLSACLCRRGVTQMREDADRAHSLLAQGSPFQGPALFLQGASFLFDGDVDAADRAFAEAADVCLRMGGVPTGCAALSERAVVAIERHDWDAAEALSNRAVTVIEKGACEEYLMSALVYAVAARVAIRRGEIEQARERIARASRLRPLCTSAFPASAQFMLELARAQLELGDAAGARAVLRQVQDILRVRPDLGVVPKQAAELQSMVDAIRGGSMGASSLTVAELRVLPFLATHFTFAEIGERLHVSRHTIKTQAMSIYRKLGVSSRTDAIEQAREIGLLGL